MSDRSDDMDIKNAQWLLENYFNTVADVVAFWRLYGQRGLYKFPDREKVVPWDEGLDTNE